MYSSDDSYYFLHRDTIEDHKNTFSINEYSSGDTLIMIASPNNWSSKETEQYVAVYELAKLGILEQKLQITNKE